MSVQVRLSANGRVCIPADVRARLGLKDGDVLTMTEQEDGLLLLTTDQAIRRTQAILRKGLEGRPASTVDDFIAERRREAKLEDDRLRQRHG